MDPETQVVTGGTGLLATIGGLGTWVVRMLRSEARQARTRAHEAAETATQAREDVQTLRGEIAELRGEIGVVRAQGEQNKAEIQGIRASVDTLMQQMHTAQLSLAGQLGRIEGYMAAKAEEKS